MTLRRQCLPIHGQMYVWNTYTCSSLVIVFGKILSTIIQFNKPDLRIGKRVTNE